MSSVDDSPCDFCDGPANTIHLLPHEDVTPQAVVFACPDCDPGGFYFYCSDWRSGPANLHRPAESFTYRDRLLTKAKGDAAVAMIEAAIAAGHGVGEWHGPSVTTSLPLLEAAPALPLCRECSAWATREFPATREHPDGVYLCDDCTVACDFCRARAAVFMTPADVPSPDPATCTTGELLEYVRAKRRTDDGRQYVCAACKREAERTDRRVVLTPATVIRSERVRWLAERRVPLRGLTGLAGEKGLGKSIFTNAHVVAAVTRGSLAGELYGRPADALVLTAEDDWRAVVKPRLMAYGADLSRVHRVEVHDKDGASLLTLPDDVRALEDAIARLRSAGRTVALVVVDPVGAFVSEATNTHAEAPVRRVLAPLAALADRLDLAVVAVMHLNKDEAKRLIARVSGAAAFVNAARSVLAVVRDPDDPDGEQGSRRLILHVGSNWGRYAATLAAHVESRLVDTDDGERADVGYLVIDGESSATVDDVQNGPDDHGNDAEELVAKELANGPCPSIDVKTAIAKRLGCSHKTVERAAMRLRDRGELTAEKIGFPATSTWTLVRKGQEPPAQSGRNLSASLVPTEGFGSTPPESDRQQGQWEQGTGIGPAVPGGDPPALFDGQSADDKDDDREGYR